MSKSGKLSDDVDQFGHPRIPYRGYYDRQHCDDRRRWAERFGSCSLEHCGQWWLNEGSSDSCTCLKLRGNIENAIGLAKVPLAICGPLLINGEFIKGYSLCPFATTEGALVASITRGATALTRAGGVNVKILEQNQIRTPYFRLRSITEVDIFIKWITNQFDHIKEKVNEVSQHAELKKLNFSYYGRVAVIHFNYTTGDAAGQNMVTSCTSHACKWIRSMVEKELPQIRIAYFCIDSGESGDKAISFLNMQRTRGYHVQAEAWIPENVIKSVLKVDITTLISCYEEWRSFTVGRIGFNINIINLITGVFIATGQDVASVESSHTQLYLSPLSLEEWKELELINESTRHSSTESINGNNVYAGIYARIAFPSINIGTVGGGTGLATQKECLNLMGCYGKDNAGRLCEIIAGYGLSLELSTLSALASGQFASAHDKLGRNRPANGLKIEHLNKEFFSRVIGSKGKLLEVSPFQLDAGNGILSDISKREMSKTVGHFGYTITYINEKDCDEILEVVIKSKTTAAETCNMLNKIAQACGHSLALQYEKCKLKLGFNYCDIREVKIYQMKNTNLRKFFPKIYYTLLQPSKDIYVVVMENLTDKFFTHLNSVNTIEDWSIGSIKVVLHDLAYMHSLYLGKTSELESFEWLDKRVKENDVDVTRLSKDLLNHAHYEFPEIWTQNRLKIMAKAIDDFDVINLILANSPLTLIHNDCNPRNACLRKSIQTTLEDDCKLCLYDWELATLDIPQRDVVEFLAFTLSPTTPVETWTILMDFYRCKLEQYSGIDYPKNRFIEVFNTAVYDFAIRRLLLYTMVHTYKDYVYLPRVVNCLFSYIETINDRHNFKISKL